MTSSRRDRRSSDAPLPEGLRVELDPGVRRIEGGTVMVGGSPLRSLRVTEAGAALVDRLTAGDPVPTRGGGARLVRRLLDSGIVHPRPSDAVGAPSPDDVAVVIPVHGTRAQVEPTLAALGPVGEVIVVDDGSPVPLRVDGQTVLRHETARGPGGARDLGWRATDRPVVAFVDAEVIPQPGWLDALLAHLADPEVVAVAPRIRPRGGTGWIAAYDAERSPLDLGPHQATVRPGSPVPYVPTACLLVRRAALESVPRSDTPGSRRRARTVSERQRRRSSPVLTPQGRAGAPARCQSGEGLVGGFDPELRFGEDVDLIWRLVAAGGTVRYDPTITATHPVRPDARAWLRQRVDYGSSAAPLALRHGAAVAPLRLSGWSAAAWGLAALGHPVLGLAVAAGSTAALARRLGGLDDAVGEAVRLAGRGHLTAGIQITRAVRRTWLPLALGAAVVSRRARLPVATAVLGPALLDLVRARSAVVPLARLADDAAYCAGVWRGSWGARTARALLPVTAGPVGPPGTRLGAHPGGNRASSSS